MKFRIGVGSFSTVAPPLTCGKTPSDHSHCRSVVTASEKVTAVFPGHQITLRRLASGNVAYSRATTEYKPNKQGAARNTVARHQPRVVSNPKWQRSSWKVVSIFQRPVYKPMI